MNIVPITKTEIFFSTEEKNILSALKYLAEEAKRSGNERIHEILQIALMVAYCHKPSCHEEFIKTIDDPEVAEVVSVLLRFHFLPEHAKKTVVRIFDTCGN